jgi:uncharacterized protein YcfJ
MYHRVYGIFVGAAVVGAFVGSLGAPVGRRVGSTVVGSAVGRIVGSPVVGSFVGDLLWSHSQHDCAAVQSYVESMSVRQ